MTDFFLSIVPIFIIVVLGHGVRRKIITTDEFWNYNDKLVYWILIPSLLFYKTSTIEISLGLLGSYATVILGGLACATAFGLLSGYLFKLTPPVASSVLQGCARHNTYIALAVAERVYGAEGLSIAALATAMLVPVTNMSLVPIMVWMQQKPSGTSVLKPVMKDLTRNPLIISVLFGFSVNFSGVEEIPFVHETTRILSGATLPVVLLSIGANLRLQSMPSTALPIVLCLVGKMIVFPLAIVVLAVSLGLSGMELYIAVLFGAAPSAPSSYALARQLGGDAPLMAAILTIQTAISIITLPVTVQLVQWALG